MSQYALQIVECNVEDNTFYILGGTDIRSKKAWHASFAEIPTAPASLPGISSFIVDKLDQNDDIVDDKTVSRQVVETLLSDTVENLRAQAKADLAEWAKTRVGAA